MARDSSNMSSGNNHKTLVYIQRGMQYANELLKGQEVVVLKEMRKEHVGNHDRMCVF
jgi:hypothetical protein